MDSPSCPKAYHQLLPGLAGVACQAVAVAGHAHTVEDPIIQAVAGSIAQTGTAPFSQDPDVKSHRT